MTRLHLATLLAAPWLCALSPRADDVSFRPADGSSVTRAYSIDLEFELGDLSAVVDGQDVSEMLPDFNGSAELMMKVTELFVRSDGGRPLELIRSYEEMSGQAEAMGESEAIEDFDKLEGKRVRFLWSEEEGEYQISFHESEGDQEDLESLTPDMDMRALLPAQAVTAGDTWTVEARALSTVLLFGDEPKAGDPELEQLLQSSIWPQVEALLADFTTTCEYLGEREVDGRKVGAIGVALHGQGRLDLTELIQSAINMSAGEVQVQLDIAAADLAIQFDAKGELLWDLAGGHLRAFDLDGDVELGLEVSLSAEVAGESHSADIDAELSSSGAWKVAPVGE